MKRIRIITTFALLFSFIQVAPAQAIYGGMDATGNGVVVLITSNYSATQQASCSGALIEPTIVVTAAHCIYNQAGSISSSITVCSPGVDKSKVPCPVLVAKTFTATDFNITDSAYNQLDDIAFLVLSETLTQPVVAGIANKTQIAQILTASTPLLVVGYGDTAANQHAYPSTPNAAMVTIDIDATAAARFKPHTWYVGSKTSTPCSGDSGAPVLQVLNGQALLVGIINAGLSSCGSSNFNGTFYNAMMEVGGYPSLLLDAENFVNTPPPAPKKISIVCQKGTSVKKVTATKPVCPRGYSKKFIL
jgi:secreted trypsin-like serine protease